MGIFIPDCKSTGGTCRQNGFSPADSLSQGSQVGLGLFCRTFLETVGNQGNATAFFIFKQIDTVTDCIHDCDEILCQLREIVVGIAAVEIRNFLRESILSLPGVLSEPGDEFLRTVFRESTMFVNAKSTVHHGLDRLE